MFSGMVDVILCLLWPGLVTGVGAVVSYVKK